MWCERARARESGRAHEDEKAWLFSSQIKKVAREGRGRLVVITPWSELYCPYLWPSRSWDFEDSWWASFGSHTRALYDSGPLGWCSVTGNQCLPKNNKAQLNQQQFITEWIRSDCPKWRTFGASCSRPWCGSPRYAFPRRCVTTQMTNWRETHVSTIKINVTNAIKQRRSYLAFQTLILLEYCPTFILC